PRPSGQAGADRLDAEPVQGFERHAEPVGNLRGAESVGHGWAYGVDVAHEGEQPLQRIERDRTHQVARVRADHHPYFRGDVQVAGLGAERVQTNAKFGAAADASHHRRTRALELPDSSVYHVA